MVFLFFVFGSIHLFLLCMHACFLYPLPFQGFRLSLCHKNAVLSVDTYVFIGCNLMKSIVLICGRVTMGNT